MLPLLLSLTALAQQPTDARSGPEAEEVKPLVKMPELVEYVQAPYPEAAKEAGIEGVVRLLIEIDAAGEVTYIEVLQPAGSGFDEAAVAAAWPSAASGTGEGVAAFSRQIARKSSNRSNASEAST